MKRKQKVQKKQWGLRSLFIVVGVLIVSLIVLVFQSKIPGLSSFFPRALTIIMGTVVRTMSGNPKTKAKVETAFIQLDSGIVYQVPLDLVKNIGSGSKVSLSQTSVTIKSTDPLSLATIIPSNLRIVSPKIYTPTTGNKKVAVILAEFSDLLSYPGNSPTLISAASTMASVKDYFSQNSYNRLSLVGDTSASIDVFGRYRLPITQSCSRAAIIPSVLSYVSSGTHPGLPSVDFSKYDFVVVSYAAQPSATIINCWGWEASVGDLPGTTYGVVTVPDQMFNINNGGYGSILAGLASNMGAYYAYGYNCHGEIIGNNCTHNSWQDDPYDLMGIGATYHLNGYVKEQMGWFGALGGSPNIKEVTVSGDYAIYPIEVSSSGYQLLKIQRAFYAGSNYSDWIYVENRVNSGTIDTLDTGLPSQVVQGAFIHNVVTPQTQNIPFVSTNLLDGTPSTAADFSDAGVPLGTVVSDSVSGVMIQPISKINNVLTVHVSIPTNGSTPTPTPLLPTTTPMSVPSSTPKISSCGGLRGLLCPIGYECIYAGGVRATVPPYPDALGTCQPKTSNR